MFPAEVTHWEARQVGLLARRHGVDPESFTVQKLAGGGSYKVRIIGHGAATVYETPDWMANFAADLNAGIFGTAVAGEVPESLRAPLAQVRTELARQGVAGALKVLNDRVPHRFTAVYRLETGLLRNVGVVDKHLHLDPMDLRVVPYKDSFCQFVLRDGIFLTSDSGGDPRLSGHPYCGVMGCYAGVPVQRQGQLAGSLCHFDLQSHEIEDDEYLLLEQVAKLLPSFLVS